MFIDENLANFIKDLSLADKKTLAQKALKVTEECGELADRVLAYEQAPQSVHKIVDKANILEESVDLLLADLSIPLSIGYTYEQIAEVIVRKAEKWQSLQNNEKQKKFMFEMHLYFSVSDQAKLKIAAERCGAKLLVVETKTKTNTQLDAMVTAKMYSNYKEVVDKAKSLIEDVQKEFVGLIDPIGEEEEVHEIEYLRTKIEVATNHPASLNASSTNKMYFESHIQVYVGSQKEKKRLESFLKAHKQILLSRNPYKKLAKGYVQMLNIRYYYVSRSVFEISVGSIYEALLNGGFQVIEKPELELCLLDTNDNSKIF